MGASQTVIKIPIALARELDRVAGSGHRSAYAVEVLWKDVRKARQREALEASAGSWKKKDHPELSQGGAAYVAKIRAERDKRFEPAISGKR